MDKDISVSKTSIAFAHFASTGKNTATLETVKRIRQIYPDAYYFLASDAVDDLSPIAKQYNLDYEFFTFKLGYPQQPFGYRHEKVCEFLRRLHIACSRAGTSHILMVEDDVLVLKPITVMPDWELAATFLGTDGIGNLITDPVVELIEFFSGQRPNVKQYGACGGSMFKVETFLENYQKVTEFFRDHLSTLQDQFNPTLGWIDCFMTVFYLLCGKPYTINPYLADTHNRHPEYDYDGFVAKLPATIEIVNNYKKYYWT